jgi:hypothetical protein
MVARLPPTTSRSGDANFDWSAIKRELKSPLLCKSSIRNAVDRTHVVEDGFTAIQIFLNSAQYGVAFWLPTLIAGFGLTSTANSQLLNIPVAGVYIIGALSQAWILDNTTRIPKPAMMLGYLFILAGMSSRYYTKNETD